METPSPIPSAANAMIYNLQVTILGRTENTVCFTFTRRHYLNLYLFPPHFLFVNTLPTEHLAAANPPQRGAKFRRHQVLFPNELKSRDSSNSGISKPWPVGHHLFL